MIQNNRRVEYALVILKPDALEKNRYQLLLKQIKCRSKVVLKRVIRFREREVRIVYPEKISENYFQSLVDFLGSGDSILIVAKGVDVGNRLEKLKAKVRGETNILINEADLQLLRADRHPRQKEITEANALRNLMHVSSEADGAVEKIKALVGGEYLY